MPHAMAGKTVAVLALAVLAVVALFVLLQDHH
jgi:hypothetical protein